jgi:hypothetical protein
MRICKWKAQRGLRRLAVDGWNQSILGVGTAGSDPDERGGQVTPLFGVDLSLPRCSGGS